MARRLFELVGAEPARRFSPFCWRIRMALAHKGLEAESVPWRFTDKAAIAFAGTDKVPVLVDGERVVHESSAIATYLEDAYPDRPSLFGGAGGRALSRFMVNWCDAALHPLLARLLLTDIAACLGPEDAAYFRTSRERRFGMTLEAACEGAAARLAALREALHPLRMTLRAQPFLGGEAPLYADHAVFGAFLWARAVSPIRLLEAEDLVEGWRQRMLDLHGGLARRALGFS